MNTARRLAIVSLVLSLIVCFRVEAEELEAERPLWIWSQQHTVGRVPQGDCYFRKSIHVPRRCQGRIEIAADDDYEVYLNGKLVGSGSSWEEFETFPFGDTVRKGKNIIAIKVTNRNGSTAGLAARLWLDLDDQNSRLYLTNPTWKSSTKVFPFWYASKYSDRRWQAARSLGRYGKTAPWLTKKNTPVAKPAPVVPELVAKQQLTASNKAQTQAPAQAGTDRFPKTKTPELPIPEATPPKPVQPQTGHPQTGSPKVLTDMPRFRAPAGFRIEHILGGEDTGSLIALTFNEFGEILASQEQGPLLLFYDTNDNGTPDASRVVCEQVKNCQGIIAISGRVFVTGDGPSGAGLYRLEDPDRDGVFENLTALIEFEDAMSEHGPHGMCMGPDGLIYIALGNHAKLKSPVAGRSPYRRYYEGEIVKPRYEDPRGHAAGITAPGGSILRMDQAGEFVELVAGGIRNAYDLAFDPQGELFVHDSDMESDEGTPWHRPTRLLHVLDGAEFGWRSGWAKWPDYFVDALPPVVDTGRGSPTGMVTYTHNIYPQRFHGTLFSCDWANGQIVSIRLRRQGGSYVARRDVFLEGKPLNVTDIDVGPDGSLYFCTGGRDTQGNVFRVVWTESPPRRSKMSPGSVAEILQLPQIDSAWGRQAISLKRADLGKKWDQEILSVVLDGSELASYRIKALSLMHLLGPPPSDELLEKLAADESLSVRLKASKLLGLINSDLSSQTLVKMLSDEHAAVRRSACESLARIDRDVSWQTLAPLLASSDRHEAFAARRLLENNKDTQWDQHVLTSKDIPTFVQGATAMMVAIPSAEHARQVLDRAKEISEDFISDADFLGILRVIQLVVERGELPLAEQQNRLNWLVDEFPIGNVYLNRELIRLLVHLQYTDLNGQFAEYLQSHIPDSEKIFLAMHLPMMRGGWNADQRLSIMQFFDDASSWDGGDNLNSYLRQGSRQFAKLLTPTERLDILSDARMMPSAALDTLFAMPEQVDADTVDYLAEVYRQVRQAQGEDYDKLRTGIIAVLASSKQSKAMAYLREIYDRDPERRQKVAMGLAQQPSGRNWDYLVRSIPLLEGDTAKEVLMKLQEAPYAPEKSEHFRQVIICGLRLGEDGGRAASDLLEYWVGMKPSGYDSQWDVALSAWQKWFEKTYPNQPLAAVPRESGENRWTLEDLDTFLTSHEARQGSSVRGAVVYRDVQCANCHRFGEIGHGFGPDLATVGSRMQRREILESIIHPSQVISDQYSSHIITLADGRTITGLMMPQGEGDVAVMASTGQTTVVKEQDIESFTSSRVSVMPGGLLNSLTLDQVADLFAFLMNSPEPNLATGHVTDRK